jgi:hypothetical protein
MPGFIAILKELVNDIVSFLRYFGAPLVGTSIVWMADADHNVIQASLLGFPMLEVAGVPVSLWALLPFLAVFGISIYSAHRAIFMPTIGPWILRRTVPASQMSLDDLSFARWKRRAAVYGSPERVAQAVLDKANAATDFLYCSCWATVILSVLIGGFFPGALDVGIWRGLGISATSAVLLFAGVFSHRNTSRLDYAAHLKFPVGH